jgi:NAD(P)-dependent dehydrogenase (short-subunit alcohol dehydrogenase family)
MQDFAEIDLDNVESTFRSNTLQMFAITKYTLPYMKEGSAYAPSNSSHSICSDILSIINATSTVAFRGSSSLVDYAARKGAITSFTQSLAKNLIPKGIRVNAIAPGPVYTPVATCITTSGVDGGVW